MRKHRAPLGWPRRDPRRYRFAVPNEVWEYKIKPIEFVIFSYLCYWYAHDRGGKNLYTILPISVAVDEFYERQLRRLELNTERNRIHKRQAKLNRCRPTAALCATEAAKAAPDSTPVA